MTIEKLAYGGEGVARPGNGESVVFVPRAAAEDLLEVEVVEEKPRFRRARLLKVLAPGPTRATPACAHYLAGCGGCQYQHLTYPAQLAAKAAQLGEALTRIGGFRNLTLHPPLAASAPLHYRNKGTFRWDGSAFGLIGVDGKTVLPIDACPLLAEPVDRVYRAAVKVAAAMPAPFAEQVLALVVRAGTATG